ncbi:MAG: glutamine--fructose-6-phosphate transaminase (isomerizing) [Oscillospiraceae bacterium]|jgi:glucosamine--fructose-6-phosphate aminotransferase (isomerizing)|nr:glutamine--fructose-6-phosphate transaminase (isomerizing) [Oscillospiraceae bacterium]
MCGIVGYVGNKKACDVIIKQLKKVEYRGYDSVGLSVVNDGKITTIKTVGMVSEIEALVRDMTIEGICGIGHTRWATHGTPSVKNAHPHSTKRVAVVHNGIIENSAKLKDLLEMKGYSFDGETDTETIAKLLDLYYEGDPIETLQKVAQMLCGSYALGLVFFDTPDNLFALKKEASLIIGICDNEKFLSSDVNAVLEYTNKYYLLQDGEIAVIGKRNVTIFDKNNKEINKVENIADWKVDSQDKGIFSHFMNKEIFEQPWVVSNLINKNIKAGSPDFAVDGISDSYLKKFNRIHIVACGTARYAGLVGKNWIEKFARIPVEVTVASEFRYLLPILTKDTLVIFISQSGETADTLAAVRLVCGLGIATVGIVNVKGSSISREVDQVIFTEAGVEVAVASTKAYLAQLTVLFLLGLKLGFLNEKLTQDNLHLFCNELIDIPGHLKRFLAEGENKIKKIAKFCADFETIFFIGRGLDYLLAQEGALKLKEISYINAQAYAAGELKHGPISLVTSKVLAITLATQEHILEKTLSNASEVCARGGNILLIFKSGTVDIPKKFLKNSIELPHSEGGLMPFFLAVSLQLLAYHVACAKAIDVDKPRNLAKSVTVE